MTEHLLKENRLKQSEIDEACTALLQQGERISTTTVHKAIGERGSFSTIQKMIKDWQARNPETAEHREHTPQKVELPDSLKQTGEQALKIFWHTARELARTELDMEREALKVAEIAMNLKLEEVQEFSDNQTNTIEVLREQLAQATTAHTALQSEQEAYHVTIATLTEQLAETRHELELSRIETETLTERLHETKAIHDQQIQELQATLTKRESETATIRADFDKFTKTQAEQANSLNTQITRLQTTLDAQIEKVQEAKGERETALNAEKVALERAAAFAGKLEFVLAENKELKLKREPQKPAEPVSPPPNRRKATSKPQTPPPTV